MLAKGKHQGTPGVIECSGDWSDRVDMLYNCVSAASHRARQTTRRGFVTASTQTQRAFICAGPTIMVLWLGGWLLFAGFIPPPAPSESAEEITRFYREDPDGIRVGVLLSIVASTLIAPFIAVTTLQLRRAEGPGGPWTLLQFGLGAILVLAFIFPLFFFMGAAFRADRSPTEVQALNDMGWIMFMSFVSSAVLQFAAAGMAMLKDRRANPVFPRWVGYFNVWCALMFCPGAVTVFFLEGPLAWNGLFVWWVPLSAFGSWVAVMTWALWRAVHHQEDEEASADAADTPDDLDALATEVAARLAARAQVPEHVG